VRERGPYDKLKAEHQSARDKEAKHEAFVAWQEQLDAKYEKQSDGITDRFKAGRISSREMLDEKRALDQEKEREIREKMKEEAKARGETLVDRSNEWKTDSRGLGHDKDRERER
jgi:hypothetical protein